MARYFRSGNVSGVIYTERLWQTGGDCTNFVKGFARRARTRLMGYGSGTGMRFKGDPGRHDPWGGAPVNTRWNKSSGFRGELKAGISVTTKKRGTHERDIDMVSRADYSIYVHEGTGDLVSTKQKRIIPKNFGYKKINIKKKRTRTIRGQRANPFLFRAMDEQGRKEGLW